MNDFKRISNIMNSFIKDKEVCSLIFMGSQKKELQIFKTENILVKSSEESTNKIFSGEILPRNFTKTTILYFEFPELKENKVIQNFSFYKNHFFLKDDLLFLEK